MFSVTAAELISALIKLPNPDDIPGEYCTIPIPARTTTSPLRALTFYKGGRGDSPSDPWPYEWALEYTPWQAKDEFIVEGHMCAIFGPNLKLGNDMDIMNDEEFDRTTDAMKDAEQQVLLNIASTLVEQMESSTADAVDDLCLERLAELDRMYPEVTGETLPEYDADEDAARPGGRTYDRQCEADSETLQAQWEAKICAAVDMMIETVTEGNESDENGQCGLWDAAQLIVPHLDRLTCSEIGDQCRRREKELHAEDDEDYTPSLQELQDAADARGEPGPLDKEPEPDLDYFEIAKSIRHKAILFNMAVLEARQHHGIITKTESAKEEGCIRVKDIRLEMPL